jgi:hypothetical protein
MRWMKAELLGVCLVLGCGSAMGGEPNQPNQQGQYKNAQTAWGDDNQAPQAGWNQNPTEAPASAPTQDPAQTENQNQPPVQQQQQVPPPAPPPPPAAQNQNKPDDRGNANNGTDEATAVESFEWESGPN